jgi:hypothetical protein
MSVSHNLAYVGIFLSLALLQACGSRQMYDAMQNRQKALCQEVPRSEYQKCMDEASQSYDTYKKERGNVEQAK